MKTRITTLIIMALTVVIPAGNAQLVVTDPVAYAIEQSNQLQDLAKYAEMINHQVEQINTLTAQLEQVTTYVERFGDPAELLEMAGADGLLASLDTEGINMTLAELQELADGAEALTYNGNGLFTEIGDLTLSEVELERDEELYRKFGAIHQSTANFTDVYDDVTERRQALKDEIASTTEALQAATTDAETQKLSGVLTGQAAELDAIDREIEFAAAQATVQKIENQNEQERQAQARAEEIAADRHDALTKMGAFMTPDTETTLTFGQ